MSPPLFQNEESPGSADSYVLLRRQRTLRPVWATHNRDSIRNETKDEVVLGLWIAGGGAPLHKRDGTVLTLDRGISTRNPVKGWRAKEIVRDPHVLRRIWEDPSGQLTDLSIELEEILSTDQVFVRSGDYRADLLVAWYLSRFLGRTPDEAITRVRLARGSDCLQGPELNGMLCGPDQNRPDQNRPDQNRPDLSRPDPGRPGELPEMAVLTQHPHKYEHGTCTVPGCGRNEPAWRSALHEPHRNQSQRIGTRTAPRSASGPAADPGWLAARVVTASARHEKILADWAAYELSLLEIFLRPALADVSVPQTAAFHDARETADDTLAILGVTPGEPAVTAYETAVGALARSWRTADQHATRVGQGHMLDPDRPRLELAVKLLRQALDEASTGPERAAFLARALTEVKGLVVVPERARTRFAIETGLGSRPQIGR